MACKKWNNQYDDVKYSSIFMLDKGVSLIRQQIYRGGEGPLPVLF